MAALKFNASKMNLPLIFLNDALADPEPQSCALRRLGGKERLKQMLGMFRTDSRSRVANRNAQIRVPFRLVPMRSHPNAQVPPIWHRLNRIADQVQEHLSQFHWKSPDLAIGEILLVKCDPIHEQQSALQLKHVIENLGNRHVNGMLRLPVETQCLFCNVPNPCKFHLAQLRIVARLLVQ